VTNLNGGLLGSTFNYVFQSTLEHLQDNDRLYYLNRTPGMNLRTQLEGNSFSEMIERNTTGTHTLKQDAFATADCKFELSGITAPFSGSNTVNADGLPVITGAGLTASVAYRWKCQINENAKLPAFSAELPEAGHNEIVGWADADDFARFAAVFLEDPGAGERMRARIELTAEIVGGQAAVVERVAPRGATRLQRLVSHVLLGDLVSLYLAVLRGTDPFGVEPIDRLKAGLAAR